MPEEHMSNNSTHNTALAGISVKKFLGIVSGIPFL